jgi:guanine nucleotide-binding protein alpha-1 subunit
VENDQQSMDEATEIIASCREDMKALWLDKAVRAVLMKRRMRVEDSAGFFLNDLDRIATRTYEPSDDDIVRARLRTLGVQEYRISFDNDTPSNLLGAISRPIGFGQEWILYDVGGSRTRVCTFPNVIYWPVSTDLWPAKQRQAWLPYFDAVDAIIFLAPISCFDERLLEDHSINRLEDSFLLWRHICSSELLAQTTMILFLNKCDLLRRKLKGGIRFKDYLPSFGDRPNDPPTVTEYLKKKFKDILRQSSPDPRRTSYFYPTSVTDTKATSTTLGTVRDSILRDHLKSADIIL